MQGSGTHRIAVITVRPGFDYSGGLKVYPLEFGKNLRKHKSRNFSD